MSHSSNLRFLSKSVSQKKIVLDDEMLPSRRVNKTDISACYERRAVGIHQLRGSTKYFHLDWGDAGRLPEQTPW